MSGGLKGTSDEAEFNLNLDTSNVQNITLPIVHFPVTILSTFFASDFVGNTATTKLPPFGH